MSEVLLSGRHAASPGSDGVMAGDTLARHTSVIIVTYNPGDYLKKCIESIVETEPEVEIIVVDNASSDEAAVQLQADYPQVRCIYNVTNTGFGAGNNLGEQAANREFLVFLNPDSVALPGWLEAIVSPLADPSVGLVTPKVLVLQEPARINTAGLTVHLSGIGMCRGLGRDANELMKEEEVASISGVAFATRRDVFQTLKGFDEDFFLYVEDVDISVRTWLAGYRCLYTPSARILHDYQLSVDGKKSFLVERGRYLMLLKTLKWRSLIALLPMLLLTEVITLTWLILNDPPGLFNKARAWRWVMAHWAETMRKRQQVQSGRAVADRDMLGRWQWSIEFEQLSESRMAAASRIVLNPFLWAAGWIARHAM